MADKDRERKAVEVVLKHMPELQGFIDISEPKQERPDFVFRNRNEIIGLEHIEIPILPMKGQNADRFFDSKGMELFKKWKAGDKYLTDSDGAVNAIQNHINEKLSVYTDFSHMDYLENCARLLGVNTKKKRKHDASEYLKQLHLRFPDCDTKIGFVLDIAYDPNDLSHFTYRRLEDDSFHTHRFLDYPFTLMFLFLIRMLNDVDVVYLVWHPIDDYKSKYVKFYDIHFDEKHELNSDLATYKIPRIWWDFDYSNSIKHGSIKLNLEKEEERIHGETEKRRRIPYI